MLSDTLLLFVGVESDSFERDPATLQVLFKIRNDNHINQAKMSHISPGLMNQVFQKNLNAANLLQRGLFLFRGIRNNADKLSTVMQALIFVFEKIYSDNQRLILCIHSRQKQNPNQLLRE